MKPKVLIIIRDGLIEDVISDQEVEVAVVDYDPAQVGQEVEFIKIDPKVTDCFTQFISKDVEGIQDVINDMVIDDWM